MSAKTRAATERMREQRQHELAAQRRRQQRVRIAAALAVIALVVGAGVAFQLSRAKVDPSAIPKIASTKTADGVRLGTAKAPVLDVYEDFQCPICRAVEASAGQTIADLAASGDASVVIHPLSFLGEESVRAANAAGCAANSRDFARFHSTLFADQPAEGTGGFTTDDLLALAKKAGITDSAFTSCVRGNDQAAWVHAVAAAGNQRGVVGTPTFYLDGKQLSSSQLTAKGLRAAVAAAS
jgi:protein-disulfide isomerase